MFKKILVIEPETMVLNSITACIEDAFPQTGVYCTESAMRGWEMWMKEKHDLIILHMFAGQLSGFVFLERLGKMSRQLQIQKPMVIMTTNTVGNRHEQYARSLGADGYVRPPYMGTEVVKAIQETLELQVKRLQSA